jgi:CHAT domain-containing protein/tetratricopeptide (TPR) repeat protein
MKKVFIGLLALNLSLSGVGIWPHQTVLAQYQLDRADILELNQLTQLAKQQLQQHRHEQAISTLQQALRIARKLQLKKAEAKTLNEVGRVYRIIGQLQKSLEYHNQALTVTREMKNRISEVITLNNIGVVYRAMSQRQKALKHFNQALDISREIKYLNGETSTLTKIGIFYHGNGQRQKALEYFNQSLSASREAKDKIGEAKTLNYIGWVYRAIGQRQKALEYFNQALPITREVKHRNEEAKTLTNIGVAYSEVGQWQKALEYYNKALPISKEARDRIGEARILNNIGKSYSKIGQTQKALEHFNQSLSISKEVRDRTGEATVLQSLILIERSRGNLRATRTHVESIIKLAETTRTGIFNPDYRTSFFASQQVSYNLYIDVLMQLHQQQPSEGFNAFAFQASERSRARSLIDLLKESQTDIRQGVDPKLLEQERNLQFQLNALDKRRAEFSSKAPTQGTPNFEQEYNILSTQYEDLKAKIRANSPRYATLTQPQTLTLAELQQQVLDNNTVLLEYFIGKERSYLWAVTQTGITSYELPKQTELEPVVQKFQKVVSNPNAQQVEINQAGKPLTQALLGPIASQLGQKRLLIVSNGALQYLPFAALPNLKDSQPLLVNHEIINLPSASTLATLRQELNGRKPAPKPVAMFADPVFSSKDDRVGNKKRQSDDKSPQKNSIYEPFSMVPIRGATEEAGLNFERLKGTRQEAKNILQLLPENMQTQALDFEANKNNVLDPKLSQYRIIHFATHGILNTTRPELSAVVLSLVDQQGRPQNGFLRLNDIFNLNLPAELVVLSACQTGLGQDMRGEGLIGLTRGFMYAGSPRVLVSLWSVNDDSTAVLMTEFYKAMLQQNLTPAAALRAAQLKMLQSQWKSPYHWAAFTLQGEWR